MLESMCYLVSASTDGYAYYYFWHGTDCRTYIATTITWDDGHGRMDYYAAATAVKLRLDCNIA
jgi:hypothetical protein